MELEIIQQNRPGLCSQIDMDVCFLSYVYMNGSKWGRNIWEWNKMINVKNRE